jgi:hypothetical protein
VTTVAAGAKLNATGTQLVYSTLLPVAPAAVPRPVAMAVDSAGEVYIATTTAGAVLFPTTPGAFQSAPPPYPKSSGVIAKLNASGSALLYATHLSGSGLSVPQGIAIDAAGDAFVAVGRGPRGARQGTFTLGERDRAEGQRKHGAKCQGVVSHKNSGSRLPPAYSSNARAQYPPRALTQSSWIK